MTPCTMIAYTALQPTVGKPDPLTPGSWPACANSICRKQKSYACPGCGNPRRENQPRSSIASWFGPMTGRA